MSDKPKYKKVATPVGDAVYPKLTGPQPDTKFDSNGVWHTKVAYTEDEIAEFVELLEEIRDARRDELLEENKRKYAKYTLADVVDEELDDDGEATGRLILKAKMKAHVVTKGGKEWDQQPNVFDCSSPPQLLNQKTLKLGGGSRIRLEVEVVPYAMDSSKTIGVSLRLRGVQVIELREWGGEASTVFGGFEGGFTSESSAPEDDSPFDGEDDDGDY